MNMANRTALVTGATGGIGQAIARELAARGASMVLTGRRADVLESLAAEIGGRPIVADLSDRTALEQLIADAGPLDILVANAALPAAGQLDDFALDEIDRALDVNLRVPITMARLAADEMISRGRGHLVFVSSMAGKLAAGSLSLYSATKFGLRGFSQALRQDLRPRGVGVSVIFPGFISDAGMFAQTGVTLPRGMRTNTPAEVGRAVAHAIEHDRAEVDVAQFSVRLVSKIAGAAPSFSTRLQQMAGGAEISRKLAEAQRHNR